MLLYDGDCGFCTVTATWLSGRLRTPVLVVPWQEVHDLGELDLSPADVTTALYWVDVYGHRYRGHEGVARFLRLCRQPLPVAGALMTVPPVSWLARAAYRLIALNRHRLPGATAACRLPRPVAFTPPGPAAGVTAGGRPRRLPSRSPAAIGAAVLSRRARRRATAR